MPHLIFLAVLIFAPFSNAQSYPNCSSIGASGGTSCPSNNNVPVGTICRQGSGPYTLWAKFEWQQGSTPIDDAPPVFVDWAWAGNCGGGGQGYSIGIAYSEPYVDEPPPPSCSILAGYKFAYEDHFPEDWEYVDEQDCYAMCQYVIDRAEGDESITCTYTGDFRTEPDPYDPDDAPYGNQPDPNSPEFCNVPGEYENTCLDWDHPSNNPDENEGCSSGSQYGVVDYGNGPVGICSPSGGGGDGFDYGSGVDTSVDQDGDGQPNSSDNDIDGDGIPNDADPDRDGDGVPNADDPNPDGNQGNGEGQDGTDSQGGEGEGPKGQASTCAKAPKSTGDPQLAAIHLQLWYNRCKGKKIDDVYNAIEKTNEALGKMTEEVGENESDTLVGNVSTGAINDLDTFGDAHIADIGSGSEGGGPMAGIVESSGVKSFFTSLVPQPQSCSSMQLAFASKFSLPIPCEKFMLFKTWFGWALGIMTAYAIIMLALTPAASKV